MHSVYLEWWNWALKICETDCTYEALLQQACSGFIQRQLLALCKQMVFTQCIALLLKMHKYSSSYWVALHFAVGLAKSLRDGGNLEQFQKCTFLVLILWAYNLCECSAYIFHICQHLQLCFKTPGFCSLFMIAVSDANDFTIFYLRQV